MALTKEQQAAKQERELLEAKQAQLVAEGAEKKKILEINVKLAESSERLAAAFKQEAAHRVSLSNETENQTEVLKKLNEAQADAKKATESFDSQLQRSIKTLTGVTDASDTLMGSFAKMAKGQKTLGGIVDETKKSFDKAISGQKIGLSVAQKLVEGTLLLAKANDTAMASFNGATGAGGSYNKQIIELEKENRKFGIGAAESAASLQNLIGGLSGFGLMAKDTQTALADEVSELQKLGAAGADTTGVFQSATKTFGMTTDAAIDLNKQAETLAHELGISVGQAVGDLNKTLPQLANLARDQVSGAFKRLSEQAIETGMSIDQLTSISDKFMTFESASEAAGNLNAVLGTQMFDTMGLLEAQLEGPDAFIDKLRTDLQASIGDFDTLNVFQKQSIANAAGMSVVEMRGLLNKKALTAEEEKQAKSREDNLKATMDLMAELKALGAELTVAFSPVIKGLKFVLSSIAEMLEGFRKLGEKIPLLSKGLGGGVGTLAGAGALAMGGKFVAKKISSALGFAREKLGTSKNNPMYTKDVNDPGSAGDSTKDKMMKRMGKWFQSTKLGTKMSSMLPGKRFGLPGGSIGPSLPGGGPSSRLAGAGKWLGRAGGVAGVGMGAYNIAKSENKGKSLFKGLLGAGAGFLVGGPVGAAAGFGIGSGFHNGTDNTPKGPIMVGDDPGNPRAKPELVVPPPGSAVINNENTKALSVAMRGGGQSNGEVLTAIKALAAREIVVNNKVEPVMLEKTWNGQFNKKNGIAGTT